MRLFIRQLKLTTYFFRVKIILTRTGKRRTYKRMNNRVHRDTWQHQE